MSGQSVIAGERLDQYVVRQQPHLSRSLAVKLIEDGHVLVNKAAQTKAGHKLHTQDKVKINTATLNASEIPSLQLPIIYEDKTCLVINKPIGVLTHSKGAYNPEETVASWLEPKTTGFSGDRGGIVHRLDRATSGVMICAKTPEALSWLQKQFAQHKSKKVYLAVVEGELNPAQAIIDMPIERHPKKPQTFRVGRYGKPAQTAYKVLHTSHKYSLVELAPTTGRTHQLRVHMEKLGHPIVGDTFYGGVPASRLMLHAKSLEITLPSKRRKVFEVPEPPEFQELVQ
jgi:23S rRNA pseudouridine1911/1915/1917 synthase